MFRTIERALLLSAVVLGACGGGQKPAETAKAGGPSGVLEAKPAEATADLSPVEAPPGLFLVGRLKTPVAVADRLGAWLGFPGPVLDLIPSGARELTRVLDREAPVEIAALLDPTRKHEPVVTVVSIGVTSLAQAVEEAQAQGADATKVAPGIVKLNFGGRPSCAVAVALGRAPARLVCAGRARELDALLPYATRGLPTLDLGKRDLELSLDLVPLVDLYRSELDGARLFAGFVVRQLELDSPRFDRAVADVVNGIADELVLLSRDVKKIRLGGVVSEARGEIMLDLDFELGQQKSLVAGVMADSAKYAGEAPAAFFTLPGDAQAGGYSRGLDVERFSGVKRSLTELADAYLEHEKVGRAGREHARRVVDLYFQFLRARATVTGDRTGAGGAAEEDGSFGLSLYDEPPKALEDGLSALMGLVRDRSARRILTKRFAIAEAHLPSARFVPLKAQSLPAGSRALVISIPKELEERLRDKLPPAIAGSGSGRMLPPTLALAVLPHGSGAVFGYARTPGELAGLLAAFLGRSGPTLADRSELGRLREYRARGAYFATLPGLVSAISRGLGKQRRPTPSLPLAPLVVRVEPTPGLPGSTRVAFTIPKSLLQAIPSAVPTLIAP